MDFNIKIIGQTVSNSKKGVAALIADYTIKNVLNSESITENTNLNLAFYYENREREYGLSWMCDLNILQLIDKLWIVDQN